MKLLFTSVGRRVELIQAFKQAANELNIDLEIIGCDLVETAPALYYCDKSELVCHINDKNYIPMLLKICNEKCVDCLIPTIDTDLMKLAKNKSRFEKIGTKVFVPCEDKVKLCRDKRFTASYFNSLGLKSPLPTDDIKKYTFGFPAFIKPKNGSSSIDAYKINTQEELETYSRQVDNYIIQPFIFGKEYTIDIFCDYEGNPIYITPRERLAVRSGEVLKTKIVQDQKMIEEMKILINDFKPSGAITVQLIKDENTNENYYIEINPRFGGGAPLSIKAGANSAKATLKILNNETLSYMDKAAEDGAIYSRFDQSIRVK